MLLQLEQKLTVGHFKALAQVYEVHFEQAHRNCFFEDLVKKGCLRYDRQDLITELADTLKIVAKGQDGSELVGIVDEYTNKYFGLKRISKTEATPTLPQDQPTSSSDEHYQETGSNPEEYPPSPRTIKKILGKQD